MAVDPTQAASPAQGGAGSPKAAGFNALSSEQFIKILTTELSKQDPLAPNDSKAILEQISSIRAIESNQSLKTSLESLVSQNQFAAAGALIGKYVEGRDDQSNDVGGVVKSVANTRNGAEFLLSDGARVPFKSLTGVFSSAPQGAAGAAQ